MKNGHRYVVFSDLDGTLLDHDSYSHEAAGPALEELRRRWIPLVFCTSKTRAEVEAARRDLGNQAPFIVENGAAIFIPRGYFRTAAAPSRNGEAYEILRLGVPYPQVVAALRRASARSGCKVRGFADMNTEEVARRCGLSRERAELAKRRDYDEPFVLLSESPAEIGGLLNQIEEEGLSWTRGGRFYHVRGRHNKGQAVRILTSLFRRADPGVVTVGAGDGPNDISLLEAVDVPIWIPARHGRTEARAGSAWRLAPCSGPRGWNQAVLQVLNNAAPN
jgi:mannosyl-3-phosphoglycerate phosphatase